MKKSLVLGRVFICLVIPFIFSTSYASIITFEEVGTVGSFDIIHDISGFTFSQSIQGTLYSGVHVSPIGCSVPSLVVTPCNVMVLHPSYPYQNDSWVTVDRGGGLFNYEGAYIATATDPISQIVIEGVTDNGHIYTQTIPNFITSNSDTPTWVPSNMPGITFLRYNIGSAIGGVNTLDNFTYSLVPIPPALWLFGSGLLGLVGIARRRS